MNCENKENCPCTVADCKNHGHCCACVNAHLKSDYMPYPNCFNYRDKAKA